MESDYRPDGEEPRVMSREDVHAYRGLTLNESGEEERKEEPRRPQSGFHVRVFTPSAIPWWKKALFWGAAAAAAALVLVVAWFFLVGGFFLAALIGAAYLLRKFLSRR